MASRKHKHYFTAHPIIIPTSYPLRDVFESWEAIGRISKWAAVLASYTLSFVSRSTIKTQALVDFIVDWTPVTSAGYSPMTEPV